MQWRMISPAAISKATARSAPSLLLGLLLLSRP